MSLHLKPADVERFHAHVDRTDQCWIWTGETNNKGYGRFPIYRSGERTWLLAHRVAFALASEQPERPPVVRHTCDNPPCCRPDHLLPGDQASNMRDAADRGRADRTGLDQYRADRDRRVLERIASGVKTCSGCHTVKPFGEFARANGRPDGRQCWCRECTAAYRSRRNLGVA